MENNKVGYDVGVYFNRTVNRGVKASKINSSFRKTSRSVKRERFFKDMECYAIIGTNDIMYATVEKCTVLGIKNSLRIVEFTKAAFTFILRIPNKYLFSTEESAREELTKLRTAYKEKEAQNGK